MSDIKEWAGDNLDHEKYGELAVDDLSEKLARLENMMKTAGAIPVVPHPVSVPVAGVRPDPLELCFMCNKPTNGDTVTGYVNGMGHPFHALCHVKLRTMQRVEARVRLEESGVLGKAEATKLVNNEAEQYARARLEFERGLEAKRKVVDVLTDSIGKDVPSPMMRQLIEKIMRGELAVHGGKVEASKNEEGW